MIESVCVSVYVCVCVALYLSHNVFYYNYICAKNLTRCNAVSVTYLTLRQEDGGGAPILK